MFGWINSIGKKPEVDDDLRVLAALMDAGSNLAKEHNIDFFLYFKSEADAQHADAEIRKSYPKFIAEIAPAASLPDWWVIAYKGRMVPSLEDMRSIRNFFDEVSGRYGGDYDGWGAEIEN